MIEGMNRDEILRRFETLLDTAMAAEEPPGGVDAEILALAAGGNDDSAAADRRCDSYALWSAMTTLAQEVKLQGRAFKELSDAMSAQAVRGAAELQAAYRERERDLERATEHRCRKEMLGALIDLRDRLGRGLESAKSGGAEIAKLQEEGWLQRLLRKSPGEAAAATLTALTKGYELGVERLDQTLDEFQVREIRCLGQLFDPYRMNAIDLEVSDGVPEGTVLEVYRSGYEWNGDVFRPAQVKVSRAPGYRNAT